MTRRLDQHVETMKAEEQRAWQSYEQAKSLYHISSIDSLGAIAIDGIRAGTALGEEPAIWFFTEREWAGRVAASVYMLDFALYRIRKSAIRRETIRWDNVAEHCAAVSFYCLKAHIPKSYVSLAGCYSLGPTPSNRA